METHQAIPNYTQSQWLYVLLPETPNGCHFSSYRLTPALQWWMSHCLNLLEEVSDQAVLLRGKDRHHCRRIRAAVGRVPQETGYRMESLVRLSPSMNVRIDIQQNIKDNSFGRWEGWVATQTQNTRADPQEHPKSGWLFYIVTEIVASVKLLWQCSSTSSSYDTQWIALSNVGIILSEAFSFYKVEATTMNGSRSCSGHNLLTFVRRNPNLCWELFW